MVNELQTKIWQLCLICADLHWFFLSNHLSSQATGGCHGDHWPTWRVIKGLESLWLQSSDLRLKKSRMLARTETYDDWYEVTRSHVAKGHQIYDHLSKTNKMLFIFCVFPFFLIFLLCSSSFWWKTKGRDTSRLKNPVIYVWVWLWGNVTRIAHHHQLHYWSENID